MHWAPSPSSQAVAAGGKLLDQAGRSRLAHWRGRSGATPCGVRVIGREIFTRASRGTKFGVLGDAVISALNGSDRWSQDRRHDGARAMRYERADQALTKIFSALRPRRSRPAPAFDAAPRRTAHPGQSAALFSAQLAGKNAALKRNGRRRRWGGSATAAGSRRSRRRCEGERNDRSLPPRGPLRVRSLLENVPIDPLTEALALPRAGSDQARGSRPVEIAAGRSDGVHSAGAGSRRRLRAVVAADIHRAGRSDEAALDDLVEPMAGDTGPAGRARAAERAVARPRGSRPTT